MIPYLYKANRTTFDSGFIGTFDNAISCNVIETLNGTYELHMQILNNDPNLENMEIGSIIVAKPNQTYGEQPFIIEQLVKHIDGTIDIYAVHMSQHRTKLIPVAPFTATDLADTLDKIATNSQEANPFTITTDKSVATNFVLDVPKTMRELMGGSEGSILDIYGGEWFYSNFDIMLLNRRGRTDSNLKVLYGSNMTEYLETDEFSWSLSYTGILPYYKDEENLVVGDIQYSDHVDDYSYHKTIAYDFSDRFDSVPTKAEVENVCQTFIAGKGVPHVSIEVSFEDLSSMPIYGQLYENANYIQLGDTVEIINSAYNTQFRSRVRTLDYNVLLERYNTIKIGDQTATINDVISDISSPSGVVSGGGGSSGTIIYDGNSSSDPQYADLFMETLSIDGTNIVKQIIDSDGNNIFPNILGGKFDEKWTNNSPTSTFGSQTIPITNLEDYEWFAITARESTNASRGHTFIITKYAAQVLEFFPYTATPYYMWARPCRISSTGITFDPCYGMSSYATYQSTPNNNYCIPTAIYGFK